MDKIRVRVHVLGTVVKPPTRWWWWAETLAQTRDTFLYEFEENPYSSDRPPVKGDFINIFAHPTKRAGKWMMEVVSVNHPGGDKVEFEVYASFTFGYFMDKKDRQKLADKRQALIERLMSFGYTRVYQGIDL